MFRQPPLPYEYGALEPAIAEWSVKRHYEDNHAGYYRKVNELTEGTFLANQSLLTLALGSNGPLKNSAAQAWIHDFWWRSMSPVPQRPPKGFEFDRFKKDWLAKGVALFGSGWLWLVRYPNGVLGVEALPDAEMPQTERSEPILVMDLWEHAYYCQYGTKRKDYLEATLPHLNWAEAVARLRG